LGIGFGLQNIVSNFVSGLILLVERPIKVGDWIIVGGAEGTVKRISVRATEIETFQRQSIIVPNSELINSQVGNWTFKSKNGRVDINVGIAYGSDIRLAEKILYEIAHEHAMVQKKPEPSVWFTEFGASSLDLRLRMFLYDISNLVTVETEVRMLILERFTKAGIDIPFPQQDVHLKLPGAGAPPLEAQIKQAAKKTARRKPTSPG
jgi:small-conductance mechanosensitive channel